MIQTIPIIGLFRKSFIIPSFQPVSHSYGKFLSLLINTGISTQPSSFSSSVYTPGRDQVQSEFGISEELALLPFILYLLGMAFGPLIAAPSSETFGRRAVYQICIPISAMFNIGAGFSQNSTSLIVCRFFAGLFSSPGMSVGTGAISDLWTSDQRGVAMAAYFTMPLLGPAMGYNSSLILLKASFISSLHRLCASLLFEPPYKLTVTGR